MTEDIPDIEMYHCAHHGDVEILHAEPFTGFAGGTSWVLDLACGCHIVDESDDVRAAE